MRLNLLKLYTMHDFVVYLRLKLSKCLETLVFLNTCARICALNVNKMLIKFTAKTTKDGEPEPCKPIQKVEWKLSRSG